MVLWLSALLPASRAFARFPGDLTFDAGKITLWTGITDGVPN